MGVGGRIESLIQCHSTKVIDLLAGVRLADQAVGFLIHVEAQASSEADFTRRIFFYFARLHQKYLQRIYPVVIFSFDEPYREESHQYTVEFDDLKVVEFNFCAIQLNRLHWRDTDLKSKCDREKWGAGVEPLAGGFAPTPPSVTLIL